MEQLRQDNSDQGPVADVPKAEERRVESVPAWGPVQRAPFRFLLISRGFHWINEWPINR